MTATPQAAITTEELQAIVESRGRLEGTLWKFDSLGISLLFNDIAVALNKKRVAPLVDDIYDNLGVKALLRTSRENVVDVLHALITTECRAAPNDGSLKVWYGPMPESNGRHNYTAILHCGDLSKGHTIDRSEYPERVRYQADRVRWLIRELDAEPFILDYDADKHSGYREPAYAADKEAVDRVSQFVRVYKGRRGLDQNCIHGLDGEYELRPADLEELVRTARRVPSVEKAKEHFDAWFAALPEDEEGFKVFQGIRADEGFLWQGYKLGRGLE